MKKATSILLLAVLCLAASTVSLAQEPINCQMQGDPGYMQVMIDPNSYLYQREEFVKQFSEKQLMRATGIEFQMENLN